MSIDSVANFASGGLSSAYRSELPKPPSRASIVALLSIVALTACSKGMTPRGEDQTRMVSTDQAFALPEVGGPAVTAVLERRYSNATEQDVLLATSSTVAGQNMLRVQVFGPVDTTLASQDKLRAGYLVAKNVNAEMRQAIPGVRMQTSAYYVQNKYGPFGYAVGRSGSGDTCLYGWQRITSTGVAQTWIGNKGSIQVRLRLCDQSASEMRLLQAMYGYTINASFKDGHWNPYGTPLPPDETLGRGGAPIYPVSASRFETVAEPIAEAQVAPKRQASQQRQATAEPPRLPAPTGPVVPPPPGTSGSGVVAASPAMSAPAVPPPPCSANSKESFCN